MRSFSQNLSEDPFMISPPGASLPFEKDISFPLSQVTDTELIIFRFSEESQIFREKWLPSIEKPTNKQTNSQETMVVEAPEASGLGVSENSKAIQAFREYLYEEAYALLSNAIDTLKGKDGDCSKQRFVYENNIGCIQVRKGEYESGLRKLEEIFSEATTILGTENFLVLVILNNLLCVYNLMERIYQIKLRESELSIFLLLKQVSLVEVKDNVEAYCKLLDNFGDLFEIMSGYKEGHRYMDISQNAYESSLSVKKKFLPENDSSIAKSFADIAMLWYEKMDYKAAIDNFQKALDINKHYYGEAHLEVSRCLSRLSSCHRALFQYDIALKYEMQAIDIKNKLFHENQDSNIEIAESLQSIGRLHYNNRSDKEALNCITKAIEIVQRTAGEQSLRMASLYEDAGLIKLSQNEFKGASMYLHSSEAIYKKSYGQVHYKIAACLGYTGKLYKHLEDFKTCQVHLLARSKMMCDIFGEESPYTADAIEDIATAQNNQGLFQDALVHHQKVLEIRKKAFGDEGLFTADSYTNIGTVLYNIKEFSQAVEQYQKALKIYQEQLGNHCKVANVTDYLAECLVEKGDYDDAFAFHNKALEMRRQIYNGDHPAIGDSYRAIGTYYSDKEEHKTAITYFEKALKIYEKQGTEHYEVANIYNDMGNSYRGIGRFDDAYSYYQKALKIREDLFGHENLSVAYCYYLIGMNYIRSFEYEEAIESYEKTLKLYLKLLGENHSNVANVYEVMGNAYYSMSKFTQAMESFSKALEIRRALFSEENVIIADSLYNIGRVNRVQNNFREATDYYKEALHIYTKVLSPEHSKVAIVYEAIGNSYRSEREYDEALKYHYRSLEIRKKLFGEQHRLVAQSYYNISLIYFIQEEYSKSMQTSLKALGIYQGTFGLMHVTVSNVHENIAKIYKLLKDYDSSVRHYEKVYTIKKKIFGIDHKFVTRIKQVIKDLKLIKKKYKSKNPVE